MENRNPDVLTSIANLSSDEVFTPPKVANQMLDLVSQAWASKNNGENLWELPETRFLDPVSKSGVFLREIVSRLNVGLTRLIPDPQSRVNHILENQVFGIAVTELTSLMSRRSVYCSKTANGPHSICSSFTSEEGNIWFSEVQHDWTQGTRRLITADESGNEIEVFADGKCKFCGAGKNGLGIGNESESHAYPLIHNTNPKQWLGDVFGEEMQFDVIIGNPPYHIGSDGGTRDVPIYQKFVAQAQELEPRFLCMVIPSRWMAGGLGLGEFRKSMLSDRRIRKMVDYSDAGDVFPGITLTGGVSYFLWDRDNPGSCEYSYIRDGQKVGDLERELDQHDILIRDVRAIPVLDKVTSLGEVSMKELMSSRTAFGLLSNFDGYSTKKRAGDVRFYATSPRGRVAAWVSRSDVSLNLEAIDKWKAMVPEARGPEGVPDVVLGKPFIAEPGSVCTQSFLFVQVESQKEAESILSYYRTKFLRFLVLMRKITQHTNKETYAWVPVQSWDRTWTDEELYAKYGLSETEIQLIEEHIKPMSGDNG